MHNYKELKVWQKAMDFVVAIYNVSRQFPKDELHGLTSQLRRAAVSIPSNIAERAGCDTDLEVAKFLDYALRSAYECAVQLQIAKRLTLAEENLADGLIEQAEEIARMRVGLIKHYAPNTSYLK